MSARSAMPCLRFVSSNIGVAKSRQPNFEMKPFHTRISPALSRRPFPKHHSRISSSVPPRAHASRDGARAGNCSTHCLPCAMCRSFCDNPHATRRSHAAESYPASAGNRSFRASSLSGFLDKWSCANKSCPSWRRNVRYKGRRNRSERRNLSVIICCAEDRTQIRQTGPSRKSRPRVLQETFRPRTVANPGRAAEPCA
jgi:hypothetical protein